jgi:hypothetical protein
VRGQPTVGELPCVLRKRESERPVALLVPGYWELPECTTALPGMAACAACPSDAATFEPHASACNKAMQLVLREDRAHVRSVGGGLLVTRGAADFKDLCEQPHIRKLCYMQQVCRTYHRNSRRDDNLFSSRCWQGVRAVA